MHGFTPQLLASSASLVEFESQNQTKSIIGSRRRRKEKSKGKGNGASHHGCACLREALNSLWVCCVFRDHWILIHLLYMEVMNDAAKSWKGLANEFVSGYSVELLKRGLKSMKKMILECETEAVAGSETNHRSRLHYLIQVIINSTQHHCIFKPNTIQFQFNSYKPHTYVISLLSRSYELSGRFFSTPPPSPLLYGLV